MIDFDRFLTGFFVTAAVISILSLSVLGYDFDISKGIVFTSVVVGIVDILSFFFITAIDDEESLTMKGLLSLFSGSFLAGLIAVGLMML